MEGPKKSLWLAKHPQSNRVRVKIKTRVELYGGLVGPEEDLKCPMVTLSIRQHGSRKPRGSDPLKAD